MNQTMKGNQYCFGAKVKIGAGDESGLAHSEVVTVANAAEVTQVDKLLYGEVCFCGLPKSMTQLIMLLGSVRKPVQAVSSPWLAGGPHGKALRTP